MKAKTMRKALALIFLLLATPVLAENKVIHEKNIGGKWTVGGYMTPEGRFSHCSALTVYTANTAKTKKQFRADEVAMIIKLLSDNTYEFVLVSNDWRFTNGKEYQIGFKFDDGKEMEGTATANDSSLIIGGTGDQEGEWYVYFAKSEWVQIKIDGHFLGQLRLEKSRLALEELMSCYVGIMEAQKQFDEKNGGSTGDDTFGKGWNELAPNGDSF